MSLLVSSPRQYLWKAQYQDQQGSCYVTNLLQERGQESYFNFSSLLWFKAMKQSKPVSDDESLKACMGTSLHPGNKS